MNHTQYISVSILVLMLSACSNTDSEDVKTSAIYADFNVISNGSKSDLKAQLKVGGLFSNNVLELTNGDTLVANNGSQSHDMLKRNNTLGDVEYRTSFTGDAGGTIYTITFNRPSSNESISSSVTLPDDFSFTSNNDTTLTDVDTLNISWNINSPYTSYITLSQDSPPVSLCGYYSTSVEAGAYGINIPLSEIPQLNAESGNCVMRIEVRRKNTNNVNDAFGEGGLFTAEQTRTDSFSFSY